MPRVTVSFSLEDKPIVDLGGVWKKVYKKGRHEGRHDRHRPYPYYIQCRKCGKRIKKHTWFYVKRVGNRNQKTEYYCEECFEGLWV